MRDIPSAGFAKDRKLLGRSNRGESSENGGERRSPGDIGRIQEVFDTIGDVADLQLEVPYVNGDERHFIPEKRRRYSRKNQS